jgi:quercetin dioxygenase-like cupin family protein
MIPALIGFDAAGFRWERVPERFYKDAGEGERGMGWRRVTRYTLARGPELPAAFEVRYFEIDPAGYSSLERHEHAHLVIAMRGAGRALVGDRVLDLEPFDCAHVPPMTPHRWLNQSAAPFGFLCIVDAARDRPLPIGDAEWDALRSDPVTAPYVF